MGIGRQGRPLAIFSGTDPLMLFTLCRCSGHALQSTGTVEAEGGETVAADTQGDAESPPPPTPVPLKPLGRREACRLLTELMEEMRYTEVSDG